MKYFCSKNLLKTGYSQGAEKRTKPLLSLNGSDNDSNSRNIKSIITITISCTQFWDASTTPSVLNRAVGTGPQYFWGLLAIAPPIIQIFYGPEVNKYV